MLSYAFAMLLQTSAASPATTRGADGVPSATQPLAVGRDPNEVLCRKDTPTGHLIGGSICHTRGEWEQIARAVTRRGDVSRPTACTSISGPGGFASPYC